jgi:uncharacterized phiE125 gp8 family phage protein
MKAWNVVMATPAEEPVTLDEAKQHLRVEADVADEDALITRLIAVARIQCEITARRAFTTRDCVAYLDCWPWDNLITLIQPPLVSVESITYLDEDGNPGTLSAASYLVDTYSTPGRILLKRNASWPSVTLQELGGIRIAYTAGYGDALSVPAAYTQAVLLYLGHLYENREAVIVGQGIGTLTLPLAVDALLLGDRGGY